MPILGAREVFDEKPRKRSSPDEGSEAAAAAPPPWADVPADILGTVLGCLPCLADRASVRSVCRHWRASARIQGQAPPAPLPVLVIPRFRFSCLTSDGALTAAWLATMLLEVAGDDAEVVGASADWLVAVRPSRDANSETDGECIMVNSFSGEVVRLPPLRPGNYNTAPLPGISFLRTTTAALSAPPSSGSKYTVAVLPCSNYAQCLALWQPGMTSWYFFQDVGIITYSDGLVFYQGKLYTFSFFRRTILAFEVMEDEHGVSLSCPEKYRIDLRAPFKLGSRMTCHMNMVVQRGKLVLITRFFTESTYKRSDSTYKRMELIPDSVEVFALDFSPVGLTRIHNLDGDCVFVDRHGCRSFSPGLYVGVQGDLIYFSDDYMNNHFFMCTTCEMAP